jgi:hypothetical protein
VRASFAQGARNGSAPRPARQLGKGTVWPGLRLPQEPLHDESPVLQPPLIKVRCEQRPRAAWCRAAVRDVTALVRIPLAYPGTGVVPALQQGEGVGRPILGGPVPFLGR